MKRLFFASVLIAGLAVPSLAPAATDDYSSGSAKRTFASLDFTVFTKNGKPKKVGIFSFTDVILDCDNAQQVSLDGSGFGTDPSGGPNGYARVVDHRFHKTYDAFNDSQQKVGEFEIKGRFRQHNTVIRGRFSVTGDFGGQTNCDSGTNEYQATIT